MAAAAGIRPSGVARLLATDAGFLMLLALYFLAQALIRMLAPGAVELDEAEQLLLYQTAGFGYDEQPPLYTWLQTAIFHLLGPGVAGIAILKNTLLFLTFAGLYALGRRLLNSRLAAGAAAASLLFVPQIAWEAQRDQSHSVLLMALSVWTFWLFFRLAERGRVRDYLALGVCLGLGLLTKYNYGLLAVALLLAALSLPAYRPVLLHPRLAWAGVPAALIFLPHLLWLLPHYQAVSGELVGKVVSTEAPLYLSVIGTGLKSLGNAIFSALAPLGLFYLWLAWGRSGSAAATPPAEALLARFFAVSLLLVAAVLLALKAQHVNARWLQPFLALVPLWVFLRLERLGVPVPRLRRYLGWAGLVAVLLLAAMAARLTVAPQLGKYSRLQMPMPELAAAIRAHGFTRGLVVADSHALGGNLKLHFQDSRIVAPGFGLERLPPAPRSPVLLVWDASREQALPAALQDVVPRLAQARRQPLRIRYLSRPYHGAGDRRMTLGIARF